MKNRITCGVDATVRVYHLNALTEDERKRLNGPDGGWDSEPRFKRYADITLGFSLQLVKQAREAWRLGEYHEAAIVKTDSKGWAYQATNSITENWSLNDDVEALTDELRSTSVGDIMIDSSGRTFVVAPMGFADIHLWIDCDTLRDGSNARGILDADGNIVTTSGEQS